MRIHTYSQVHMCRTHLVTGTVLYNSSLCDQSITACRQLKHVGRDEKSKEWELSESPEMWLDSYPAGCLGKIGIESQHL